MKASMIIIFVLCLTSVALSFYSLGYTTCSYKFSKMRYDAISDLLERIKAEHRQHNDEEAQA